MKNDLKVRRLMHNVQQHALDRVATPAGSCCYSPVGVDFGVFFKDILPTIDHINERLSSPILSNSVRELCRIILSG
jgi:hypothetical protein